MDFVIDEALPVLKKTPNILRELLVNLPERWITSTEAPGEWTPYDVVGHLIHGERTDWIPRVEHILKFGDTVVFPVFDREGMFVGSKGSSLDELLDEFSELRVKNLDWLQALNLTDGDLLRPGKHPEFGAVTLGQHLSTWVAHDLSHIGQIVRAMTKQYSKAVGPWRAYLSIIGSSR